MEMHILKSMIAKYSIVSWLILGLTALTSTARFLDEQTDWEAMHPQGAPASNPVPNTDLAFTFFMHDILGGYNPTAKAITGIVNNQRLSGQLPFAKPYGAVLPINSGVKVDNAGGFPFLTSLSGTTSNIFQNNGMNGARLPVGSTIEKLMFGTMTVVDDELTIGPELSSGRVGKAQGFYVSSSVDGKSQVMALTAIFETGGYADTICFFGVHLLGVSESLPPSKIQVQTDGVETVVQFTVYGTY